MKISEKKALKREAIIQASLELFSVNGFHKTTIPDIAKKLKIKSVVYSLVGSGIGAMRVDKCAKIMLTEMMNFQAKSTNNILEKIFSNLDENFPSSGGYKKTSRIPTI